MADRSRQADPLSAQKSLAKIYGIIVAILALLGFFIVDGHLFALMNADTPLDIVRVPLALALLFAGFSARNGNTIRDILTLTGVLFLVIALLGLINSTLWDLLPNGLTGFDIVFHLIAGIVALVVARRGRVDASESSINLDE